MDTCDLLQPYWHLWQEIALGISWYFNMITPHYILMYVYLLFAIWQANIQLYCYDIEAEHQMHLVNNIV